MRKSNNSIRTLMLKCCYRKYLFLNCPNWNDNSVRILRHMHLIFLFKILLYFMKLAKATKKSNPHIFNCSTSPLLIVLFYQKQTLANSLACGTLLPLFTLFHKVLRVHFLTKYLFSCFGSHLFLSKLRLWLYLWKFLCKTHRHKAL